MATVDWLAVGAYLAIGLFIGLYFVRRASASMENYFIAGRSLSWWVIGLANCATYTGGSAAWVMLVFQDGLVGNFWWWPSWVVWMPLVAVLWARYWRRMGIVTTAEFIELRYSGRMAKAYRGVYALYSCFGWAPLMIGSLGGWHPTVAAALASRGAQFMRPLPPTPSITYLVVLALFIQGFFF